MKPLLFLFTSIAAAQCPYAVPSSIHLVVPRDLSPGQRAYARTYAYVWLFCSTAPEQGVTMHVTAGGPTSLRSPELAGTNSDYTVYSETNQWAMLPTLLLEYMNTNLDPPLGTRDYSLTISSDSGQSILLPVSVTITDAPYIDASRSFSLFEIPQGSDRQYIDSQVNVESVWLANAIAPQPLAITAQSSGWLTVTPSFGTGYTEISIRGDPGSLPPGNYFGTLTITSSAVVNSPLKIPVRLFVTSPRSAAGSTQSWRPAPPPKPPS